MIQKRTKIDTNGADLFATKQRTSCHKIGQVLPNRSNSYKIRYNIVHKFFTIDFVMHNIFYKV